MSFPGLRYASSGWRAALKVSSRLTGKSSTAGSKVAVTGSAKPVETEVEPPIATMARLQSVLETYLDPKEINIVREAYRFSDQAHLGQFRSSGSPILLTRLPLLKSAQVGNLIPKPFVLHCCMMSWKIRASQNRSY